MAKKPIRDTFFLDPERALKKARKQKTLTIMEEPLPHSIFFTDIATQKRQEFYHDLQICYYPGEELKEKNIPENCINVPFDKIFDFFKETRLRYPEVIDFKGINLEENGKENFVKLFNQALSNANEYKNQKASEYIEKIKENKPNFNEPLRFFLMANRHTTVMQYVTKGIFNALKKMGYEVYLSIEKNSMEALDISSHFIELDKTNPHVTININHLNNEFLNESIFNVVWFQDPMPILFDDNPIQIREKDIIISYTPLYKKLLKNKNIFVAFEQAIPYNPEIFNNKNMKKTKQIVFAGSSSSDKEISEKTNLPINIIHNIYDLMERGEELSYQNINEILEKYNLKMNYISYQDLIHQIIRNKCVEWMCKNGDIAEVYGRNFSHNSIIRAHYKYEIQHGKELAKIYKQFKYALIPAHIMESQRLYEVSACGCIPIIYDMRNISEENFIWEDYCLFFKTEKDLNEILINNKKPKKNPIKISQKNTYKYFIKKILKYINKKRLHS